MPRKVFVAGEILTAADVNTNLMDQSVMVFDDATARTTAIPTPVEGMVTYLKDANQVQAFTGSAFTAVGGILQVVSTTKTDTFSTASTTFTDVTDLSLSITPSSASSKILISTNISFGRSEGLVTNFRIVRDSTPIALGDSVGSRKQVTGASFFGLSFPENHIATESATFLDSPNTTSSTTYKIQMSVNTGTGFVNRTGTDTDSATFSRAVSTITLMEVAG